MVEFQVTRSDTKYCCFSPDGRLVAIAGGNTAYVWDITNSNPHLVETFIGHTKDITSLAFSSPITLISASEDGSVKFWQIGAPSMDPALIGPESAPLTSAPIKAITLCAEDGIAITIDSDSIVKTWDISTGLHKASFQTPAKGNKRDVRLINGKLIIVWNADEKIHIWDEEKQEPLLEIYVFGSIEDLRISGDGSRVFTLHSQSIYAWSTQTGEVVDEVRIKYPSSIGSLTIDGLKVWAHWPQSKSQGWDFGIPGSSPVQLSNIPTLSNRNLLWDPSLARIKNTVTGEVVFQLSGRFAKPAVVQYDGSYLVAGYHSGEILILNMKHVLLQ